MHRGEDFVADPRRHVELLEQLARQAVFQRFVLVALPAGKFPEAFEVHALLPAGDQEPAVDLDDRRRDDQGSRWSLVVGHLSPGVNG